MKLKNLLFNRQTLQTVAQWVTENWYMVCLFGIVFVIFMGMFIKCCAVHTPSSNPKKPPARRITDTLRRPMNTLRRMVSYLYKSSKRNLHSGLPFSVIITTVMGHEAFLCRTMIGPAVAGAAAVAEVAPVEVEAPAEEEEEVTATANVAVGTRPRLVPLGRPTVVVPECQRMGMVKAEANNTIHRKVCSTKSWFFEVNIFSLFSLSSLKLFPIKENSPLFLFTFLPLLVRIFRFLP